MHCRLLLELIVIKNYPHFAWMFSRSSVGQCLSGISVKRCLAGWSHTGKKCRPFGHPERRTDYGCLPRPHRLTAHRQKMLSLLIIRGDVLVTGTSLDTITRPATIGHCIHLLATGRLQILPCALPTVGRPCARVQPRTSYQQPTRPVLFRNTGTAISFPPW